jgi:hypothetical protein
MSKGLYAWVATPRTEIEMSSNNHEQNRALQQDARAWVEFAHSYTAAMRQMQHPLAQGFLGERVSARQLIATLQDHPLIGAEDGASLQEDGLYTSYIWDFEPETGFIEMALITEALRMFSPLPDTESPKVDSYSLARTVEAFLKGTPVSHVTIGRLIWAAAAMGLPLATYSHGGGPSLLIGIPENEHDYVRKMVRPGKTRPQAHDHRPPGYERLRTALAQVLAGESMPAHWVQAPPIVEEPAPFHDWLLAQADRDEPIGDFASDYAEGIRTGAHRIARTPDELMLLLIELTPSAEAYDAAREAVGEWLGTMSPSPGIRTRWEGGSTEEVGGHGAGSGTIERREYLCPCGNGQIVEEHGNIPGFREHVVILCPKCRAEWRFLGGRSVYEWALEPVL